ncbi:MULTISPECIES: Hsp20/alpha crystallin family protein [Leptolyngbya]|nr:MULTISPECIES: Hsp20/alpha crystallin family protein [Leptolyngbya]MBD2367455.1 Hsp20/alpha crystallin family protein [Leptolyngbya sp. FACHB-161]MBD2373979.1 Hsp20/alpha crystallin family protein [Leptolyngbya sp. FACHB-238]MBD2398221.1 Hsp20/alpha crystallin family protein [Leptolyngbya sp. FACHB-239]MBD2404282.1 Hsp20/alpha crystallin family protein [Leptolyngbya sp. FACHB-402]MCY6489924.1 Hsp20/alpha crystallin family protein [Leptolyngbya sp. GGD]
MMTSTRLQEMEMARRQFNQLFSELMPTRETTWSPAIEFTATEAEFILRAQLPGIAAKDVDVQIGQDTVSISGEHKLEATEAKGLRSEFRYGKFRRVISLPAPVQNDQAKAELKDGILTLTLPRLQAVKPTIVKLNLVESEAQAEETADVWNS